MLDGHQQQLNSENDFSSFSYTERRLFHEYLLKGLPQKCYIRYKDEIPLDPYILIEDKSSSSKNKKLILQQNRKQKMLLDLKIIINHIEEFRASVNMTFEPIPDKFMRALEEHYADSHYLLMNHREFFDFIENENDYDPRVKEKPLRIIFNLDSTDITFPNEGSNECVIKMIQDALQPDVSYHNKNCFERLRNLSHVRDIKKDKIYHIDRRLISSVVLKYTDWETASKLEEAGFSSLSAQKSFYIHN